MRLAILCSADYCDWEDFTIRMRSTLSGQMEKEADMFDPSMERVPVKQQEITEIIGDGNDPYKIAMRFAKKLNVLYTKINRDIKDNVLGDRKKIIKIVEACDRIIVFQTNKTQHEAISFAKKLKKENNQLNVKVTPRERRMKRNLKLCPNCGNIVNELTCKKEGNNCGRVFYACTTEKCFFEWKFKDQAKTNEKCEEHECDGYIIVGIAKKTRKPYRRCSSCKHYDEKDFNKELLASTIVS